MGLLTRSAKPRHYRWIGNVYPRRTQSNPDYSSALLANGRTPGGELEIDRRMKGLDLSSGGAYGQVGYRCRQIVRTMSERAPSTSQRQQRSHSLIAQPQSKPRNHTC